MRYMRNKSSKECEIGMMTAGPVTCASKLGLDLKEMGSDRIRSVPQMPLFHFCN
jgi:hypothetical protein